MQLNYTHGENTDTHTYLEPVWQRAEQLDFDGQADESGHAAVWDGGSELDAHRAVRVVYLEEGGGHTVRQHAAKSSIYESGLKKVYRYTDKLLYIYIYIL